MTGKFENLGEGHLLPIFPPFKKRQKIGTFLNSNTYPLEMYVLFYKLNEVLKRWLDCSLFIEK